MRECASGWPDSRCMGQTVDGRDWQKVNSHDESMTAYLEQFTEELRDAWLLQHWELAEEIHLVRIETQGTGNAVSSEWQEPFVERLKHHGLAL